MRMRADTLLGTLSDILEAPEVEVSLVRFVNVRAESSGKDNFGEIIFFVDLE